MCIRDRLGHVEQFVLHPEAAAGGIDHAPNHQVVLLQRTPGRVLHFAATHWALDHAGFGQAAEGTGALQVGPHHGSHIGIRRRARPLVRHRHHGDGQGGGVAAHDVDLQPLLLGGCRHGQQQEDECSKPMGQCFHGHIILWGAEELSLIHI